MASTPSPSARYARTPSLLSPRAGTSETERARVPTCLHVCRQLFKDEKLEQELESLVGSLKAAKKRSILTFEGQMLLQGAHDHVVVTLLPGE